MNNNLIKMRKEIKNQKRTNDFKHVTDKFVRIRTCTI